MAKLCLRTKIRTKQWVCRLFNVCARVFCALNATILLVYILANIKISFIWKDDFFLPNSHLYVSRWQAHLAKWKRIGWSIGFNHWTNWTLSYRGLYAKFVSMMSPKYAIVENDTHTFCHSSNILGCTKCCWLFTLWFINEDAIFFHFCHKITNIQSIFLSVFQAYTILVQRNNKLSNHTWAMCYHSRNKHLLT